MCSENKQLSFDYISTYTADICYIMCPLCSSRVHVPFEVEDEQQPWIGVCTQGHKGKFAFDED